MNLRKQIVLVLLTLVLYKTVEPLVFCISYLYKIEQLSSANFNIETLYNDMEEYPHDIVAKESNTSNGITNIQIKLTGNRLDIEKERIYKESLKDFIKKQQEKQKPTLPVVDINISYLCPENELYYNNPNIINFYKDWSYKDKSYNCFLAILTPPPKQVGAPVEV